MYARTQIVGQYVSPNKIEISLPCKGRIQEGQRVLVCRPTNSAIVNYATGKVIGRKEQVLGTGIIKVEDGGYVVKTDKNGPVIPVKGLKARGRTFAVKANKNAPVIHAYEVKEKIVKGARFKYSQKVNVRSKVEEVIIKVIED